MAKTTYDLSKNLHLNKWIIKQFGFTSFEEISEQFNKTELEGFHADGATRFYAELKHSLFGHQENNPNSIITDDKLKFYDANVVRHWKRISEKRNLHGTYVYPKYFQYFALMFTEFYLDHFFQSRSNLLDMLNKSVSLGLEERFEDKDLDMLAFWCATGSGKTLIMHVNILQYWFYHNLYTRPSERIHKTMLLTPNPGLSAQHCQEFSESDIKAGIFRKESGGLELKSDEIEVLEITKLAEEDGVSQVAVEFFEGHNLVLVDEGHKGSGGDVWVKHRREISSGGFCFEYSATFGQVLSEKSSERNLYENSIIIDYSYKYFYKDGYGKEFSILNIDNNKDTDLFKRYLTANLVTVFQQLLLYKDKKSDYNKYLIEKPLTLFIGTTVISKKTGLNKSEESTLSDVQDIILFLSRIVSSSEKVKVITIISLLLKGKVELKDTNGNDVFLAAFPYLQERYGSSGAELLYADLLLELFNAEAPGLLHLENLKSTEGEISIKVGQADPFGVINIGDPSGLLHGLENYKANNVVNYAVQDNKVFTDSYFNNVNKQDSSINMLIGAKKFIEGWSSWRVSAIGLMNIGKSEGSQIIQLFGRGVRLKGKNMSLKRSYRQYDAPDYLEHMETLNIFGVKADYIALFRDLIEKEVGIEKEYTPPITISVKNSLTEGQLRQLYTIKLKDGQIFRKTEIIDLERIPRIKGIKLRWVDPIQAVASRNSSITRENSNNVVISHFKPIHIQTLDFYKIYTEILEFKNEKGYFNLNISLASLKKLLNSDSTSNWYDLIDCESLLVEDTFDSVSRWEQMAVALLKKYIDKFYSVKKEEFESQNRVYTPLSSDDKNLVKEYIIKVEKEEQSLISEVYNLKNSWENEELAEKDWEYHSSKASVNLFHLYNPIIYLGDKAAEIKPVLLDSPEEYDFIIDMEKYLNSSPQLLEGKEVYLMRNSSRGKGVGFFEANNFYPDFILWIKDGKKQYLNFIDPKGLRNIDESSSPKLSFYKTIKTIQESIPQTGSTTIELNSFIISTTKYGNITFRFAEEKLSKEDYESRNVLFMKDEPVRYISKIFERVLC